MNKFTSFLKDHIIGVVLFAIVTGVCGNFVYDWVRPASKDPEGIEVADAHLLTFLDDYVRSGNFDAPEVEASFFADSVIDFYGAHELTREQIIEDRKRHISEWPIRRYSIAGTPRLLGKESGGTQIISARVKYDLVNGEKHRTGISKTIYRVRPFKMKFQIVSAMEALNE